ncbi:hypothetical protein [Streptomyces sp. ST2-7A]|uniref:hypothetical protein n=1 Tax=Streptomyces sp. ST2-7A TaxID=2907214 RepID=UPI001F3FD22C|nr:hypothetical protein [Streptomyces sp. ST2-7A]MCE7081890.1 hypothetical protein [Streptomyces sp. ST2-7A]
MQRHLVHTAAWVVSTALAVTLTWWGVGSVLRGTVYDPPQAARVTDPPRWQEAGDDHPDASSTHRPKPSADASPDPSDDGEGGDPGEDESPGDDEGRDSGGTGGTGATGASHNGRSSGDGEDDGASGTDDDGVERADHGSVRSVKTDGGRVVFDLHPATCELVSATPEPGWEMQTWSHEVWIRVTFSTSSRSLSVFCVWNGHPPRIDLHEE